MQMLDNQTAIAEELAEISTQLQRNFLVELSSSVTKGNISIPQYALLSFLNQSPGLNMSQLAGLMRHTTPATTGLVDRLFAAGLVERYGHPDDRRQVLVRITEKGRNLVEGMKRDIVQKIMGISQDLSGEDIETWLRIYRVILKHCNARNQIQR